MAYSTILYQVSRGVARITLNRPERMNAINAVLYDEFCAAMEAAGADDAVRALLVTGAGERAFCAGADLQAKGDDRPVNPARVRDRNIHPERSLNGVLFSFEKPLIAAVNGVAVGGGLTMALASDIVIAADSARLGAGHAKLGLPLSDMLGYLLPRRVGPGMASDLAFTGRLVDAAEALRCGMVDRVVPAAELAAAAAALAEEIAQNAPLALYFSKQAIRRADSETYQQYVQYERYIFNVCINSEDAKEAMRARRDKRPPEWKGR
jgi:enoyl-CoA hydratase